MPHLLRIDSSIQEEDSTSRTLTARAAAQWHAANPDGTETYRDFGLDPIPHLTAAGGRFRTVPPDQHTPAQASTYALSRKLIDELTQADTIILGLPLYNFAAPSTVKAWVDHLIVPGIAFDPKTGESVIGETQLIVLASRGGGYGPGTPRDGWDHAEPWLGHSLQRLGLKPRFIAAELRLVGKSSAMAGLEGEARQSLENAHATIDQLWPVAEVAR